MRNNLLSDIKTIETDNIEYIKQYIYYFLLKNLQSTNLLFIKKILFFKKV